MKCFEEGNGRKYRREHPAVVYLPRDLFYIKIFKYYAYADNSEL